MTSVFLKDRISEQLRHDIWQGFIQPDATLTIDDLCARFRVSRTPVREALLALCGENLLVAKHRVGYMLKPIDPSAVIESYRLRSIIEPEGAARAAAHITEPEKGELQALADDGSPSGNYRFHMMIASAARGTVLQDILRVLLNASVRGRVLLSLVQGPSGILADRLASHAAICQAVCAGDEQMAASLMCRHLEDSRERVIRAVSRS
ncbi:MULTISPECIES: GntR family transcriptional regulator [Jonquetella]|uniref:Transcriptional regulator n=1 Tax=Jonquetella anthropi DSM 22815 TaxID=885272 RepID=H0ULX7_9BACT|nr:MULTISPECIES: GntR family transcriptional regulator [Jonquetella]EEX49262.1 transcriptional regulator, GntR family [Jonquetella anthropi E3_33 E1]EHM12519.1 transcriptional regulator [Jonquetella anthropi DSM 22815]ERL24800.1 FCD domain protein [Jonquetella sp. BV3C21]